MTTTTYDRNFKLALVLSHIVAPLLGYAIGLTLFSLSFGLNPEVSDFITSVPMFQSTHSAMIRLYGATSANRAIYLTFYWSLSLIPSLIFYCWLGFWSASRVSKGKQEFKPGNVFWVFVGGVVVFFISFYWHNDYVSPTRIQRVSLGSDFKFFAYTCAAIAVLWAVFAAVHTVTLLLLKLVNR
jgi:hypothetical protein